MFQIIKVSGRSLLPDYQEGDFVLVGKAPRCLCSVRQGDVVVFRHPSHGKMIKKVARVSPDGEVFHVVGTHENSVDSRHFGGVRKGELIGKVIWHIRRPFR